MKRQRNWKWLATMAWRDARSSRKRLLLFSLASTVGIAILVALQTFDVNLKNDIALQNRQLLGADFQLRSSRPIPDSIFQTLPFPVEERVSSQFLNTMLFVPKNDNSRLVQLRIQNGPFPFYGKLLTQPRDAQQKYLASGGALIETALAQQYEIAVGDSIRLGGKPILVEGILESAPGRAGVAGGAFPVVYTNTAFTEGTSLLDRGSLVTHYEHIRTPQKVSENDEESVRKLLKNSEIRYETVRSREEDFKQILGSLTNFLQLVGFIALLLGALGVGNAVQVYLQSKKKSIAVLRCLGVSSGDAALLFFLQVFVLGALTGTVGALLGSFLQTVLPFVVGDFLPLGEVSSSWSGRASAIGIGTGVWITMLFSLPSLWGLRNITPLSAFRPSLPTAEAKNTWLMVFIIIAVLLSFGGLTWLITQSIFAVWFPVGLGISVAFFYLTARVLTWLIRRFFPKGASFPVRQSLAALFRPNNQTVLLTLVLGLGVTLLSTLWLSQNLLLSKVTLSGNGDQPKFIFFDIQPSQKEGLRQQLTSDAYPILDDVPVVNMRLLEIDGFDKQNWLADTTLNRETWVFTREFRVSYRDSLIDSETIVKGEWTGAATPGELVPISLSTNVAEDLEAEIGTRLTFDVQGLPIETVVGSIREVDFARFQTNFLVLFPKGVLEKAPQFGVFLVGASPQDTLGRLLPQLSQNFPNVSVFELSTLINSVETISRKVSYIIQFMAGFALLAGLLVLINSVALTQGQRIKESVLLRTLGARSSVLRTITLLEYTWLGVLALLTGLGVAIGLTWLLAAFAFDVPFSIPWLEIGGLGLLILTLVLLVGWWSARKVIAQTPLQILRQEVE